MRATHTQSPTHWGFKRPLWNGLSAAEKKQYYYLSSIGNHKYENRFEIELEILPRKFSKWKRDPECIIPLTGQKGAANCWVVGVARVHSLAWSGLTMFGATANTSLRINCCTRIASVQLFLYAHFLYLVKGMWRRKGMDGWLYRRLPPIDCYLQICLHIRLKRQWLIFSDIYTRIYKTIFQIWNIYFNTKQSGSLK